MNIKNSFTTIAQTSALILMAATAAQAAATNKVYLSNTLIFMFLGFCALVVVIQLIPAIITLYGMIKGVTSGMKEKATAKSSRN